MTMLSNRLPCIGDIWLIDFPYATPGNMTKIRPAIILKFLDDDRMLVQKLTTRKRKGNKEFIHPKLKRKTYLSYEKAVVYDYSLIRYIGRVENRRVKK